MLKLGNLVEQIALAKEEEMDAIIKAIMRRYRELFPDWEVTMISLEKHSDRKLQLELMIQTLENMKFHE